MRHARAVAAIAVAGAVLLPARGAAAEDWPKVRSVDDAVTFQYLGETVTCPIRVELYWDDPEQALRASIESTAAGRGFFCSAEASVTVRYSFNNSNQIVRRTDTAESRNNARVTATTEGAPGYFDISSVHRLGFAYCGCERTYDLDFTSK